MLRSTVLTGTITGARAGRALAVQRRDAGRWRTVGRTKVLARGAYHARLASPGEYRIRFGDIAGPSVNVR
jgi:hypothetical protein